MWSARSSGDKCTEGLTWYERKDGSLTESVGEEGTVERRGPSVEAGGALVQDQVARLEGTVMTEHEHEQAAGQPDGQP